MDARDGRLLIIGMIAVLFSIGLGIKLGWDWGRGDFASKAATVRAVAIMKATARNDRLKLELDAERARREGLESAEDERVNNDMVRVEELLRAKAEAMATAACTIDADGLALLNQVLRGAR